MALYRRKAIEHRYRVAWGQVGRRQPGSMALTLLVAAASIGSVMAVLWLWG